MSIVKIICVAVVLFCVSVFSATLSTDAFGELTLTPTSKVTVNGKLVSNSMTVGGVDVGSNLGGGVFSHGLTFYQFAATGAYQYAVTSTLTTYKNPSCYLYGIRINCFNAGSGGSVSWQMCLVNTTCPNFQDRSSAPGSLGYFTFYSELITTPVSFPNS